MPVCTKSVKFYPNRGFFMVFNEMRHVLQVLAQNLIKTKKHATLFEKCQVLPNRCFLMVFHEMRHFLQLLAKKLIKTQKHASLFEKCQVLPKSIIFHGFSRNEALSAAFFGKEKNMQVCSKSWVFWPNRWFFMLFQEMRHFLQAFPENLIKTLKHASLFEKCQGLAKSTISHGFSQNEALFAFLSWKVDRKRKTCQFVRKVARFGQMDDFSLFFAKWSTF